MANRKSFTRSIKMQHTWQERCDVGATHTTLFKLLGLSPRGCLWVRPIGQRKRYPALLTSTLTEPELDEALARRWYAVGAFRPGLIWPILSHFVATRSERLTQTRTLRADAIVLGNHRAMLSVDDEGLCIRSRKILVHARRRLRLTGGSVDLG